MKDDTKNYVIVGAFVLAMVAGLILWIALLSGRTGATDPFWARYGNVMGLKQGTQILYEGYPVGIIESISRVDDDGAPYFRVDLSIKRGWRIPADSVAQIASSSLLGGVVIDIAEGEAREALAPGSEIPAREAANVFAAISDAASDIGSFMDESVKPLLDTIGEKVPVVVENLESLTSQANDAVVQINKLLAPENTQRISTILENLESVSSRVDDLTINLGRTRDQVEHMIASVDEIIAGHDEELSQAVMDLHHTLEAVARHIDAISSNLESTTRNMNEFSRSIRQDPSLVIRGRDVDEDGASQ